MTRQRAKKIVVNMQAVHIRTVTKQTSRGEKRKHIADPLTTGSQVSGNSTPTGHDVGASTAQRNVPSYIEDPEPPRRVTQVWPA